MKKVFSKILVATAAIAMSSLLVAQQAEKTPAPAEAQLYIVSPQNGAVVSQTFNVVFGLQGMGVAPAGVQTNNTGHHHLHTLQLILGDYVHTPHNPPVISEKITVTVQ